MSQKNKTNTPLTRSIKISDDLHHQLRVISVVRRIKMQTLTERILKAGIQREQIGELTR
jgi:hypothetical protein